MGIRPSPRAVVPLAAALIAACSLVVPFDDYDRDTDLGSGSDAAREAFDDDAVVEGGGDAGCGCPALSTCVDGGCFFRETWEGATGSAWPLYWIVDASAPIALPRLEDGGGTLVSAAEAGILTFRPTLPAAVEVDQAISISSNDTSNVFGLFCRTADGRGYRAGRSDSRVLMLTLEHPDGGSTELGKITAGPPGLAGIRVRLQCATIAPGRTEVRLNVWEAGSPEPPGFALIRPDESAGVQSPGAFGVRIESSRSLTYRFDDYEVTFR